MWWRARWELVRSKHVPASVRRWAVAEMLAATSSLLTLAVTVALAVGRGLGQSIVESPYLDLLDVLIAGAVGYGTNYLAVRMLFAPREPVTWWPMRWIWSQGLIPAKRDEMAQQVGHEVATRLLTPEAVADEMTSLIVTAMDDPETVRRLQVSLHPLLQNTVPDFFSRFMPEATVAVRDAIRSGLPAEDVKAILVDVIDDWFKDERNRGALVGHVVGLLQEQSPQLVRLVRQALKRYTKKDRLRAIAFDAGQVSGLIDWQSFEVAVEKQLGKPKSRIVADGLVREFAQHVRPLAKTTISHEWVENLTDRASEVAFEAIGDRAEETLLPHVDRLVQSEQFRTFVLDELIPRLRPQVVAWLEEGHLAPFIARFDVEGRVEAAAKQMQLEDVEMMVENVGAQHLGAIQVLGYVLGIGAGLLMVVARG